LVWLKKDGLDIRPMPNKNATNTTDTKAVFEPTIGTFIGNLGDKSAHQLFVKLFYDVFKKFFCIKVLFVLNNL